MNGLRIALIFGNIVYLVVYGLAGFFLAMEGEVGSTVLAMGSSLVMIGSIIVLYDDREKD